MQEQTWEGTDIPASFQFRTSRKYEASSLGGFGFLFKSELIVQFYFKTRFNFLGQRKLQQCSLGPGLSPAATAGSVWQSVMCCMTCHLAPLLLLFTLFLSPQALLRQYTKVSIPAALFKLEQITQSSDLVWIVFLFYDPKASPGPWSYFSKRGYMAYETVLSDLWTDFSNESYRGVNTKSHEVT